VQPSTDSKAAIWSPAASRLTTRAGHTTLRSCAWLSALLLLAPCPWPILRLRLLPCAWLRVCAWASLRLSLLLLREPARPPCGTTHLRPKPAPKQRHNQRHRAQPNRDPA
jgi:hypothetical protein